jgi:hypothetical protein
VSPAFASTTRETALKKPTNVTIARIDTRNRALPGWRFPCNDGGCQRNNQHFRDHSIDTGNKSYVGRNQGNDGNQGVNRGVNIDNSTNEGNRVSNRHCTKRCQENNQYYQARKIHSSNLYYRGVYQGNDGNSGFNSGFNEDNSTNEGNQVNN